EQNALVVIHRNHRCETGLPEHGTGQFSVSAWLVNNWYPTASISDLLVVVMKKATAGITIS
ncbi:hypothetical protein, partial [Escherichia coli]|uniref:hypothetical protein n=1 Tax=Escherichia coli TaxID=562 RepID=UPI003EB8CCD2